MKKSFYLFLVSIFVTVFISACSGNQGTSNGTANSTGENNNNQGANEVIATLSFGTYNPSTGPDGIAAEFFKEYVEEHSNGQIKVDVFHNGQLGATQNQIEGVMMGSQDLFMTNAELLAPWAPEANLLASSYLFNDADHLLKFLNSELFDGVHEKLKENNILLLNSEWNWVQGPFRVLVSKKPVESVEDLKGMRMRVFENEMYQRTWRAFGTNTTVIAFPEIYLALQQGLVEALEVPMNVVRENNYTEVAKHITRLDSYPQRYQLLMNLDKFNGLPQDMQELLRKAAYEAGEVYSQTVRDNMESDIEFMIAEHEATYKDDLDLEPFREIMAEQYEEMEREGFLELGITEKIKSLQ